MSTIDVNFLGTEPLVALCALVFNMINSAIKAANYARNISTMGVSVTCQPYTLMHMVDNICYQYGQSPYLHQ